MTAFLLILVVVALIILRQNVMIVLGVAVFLANYIWGDLNNDPAFVLEVMFNAASREVLLSIPLYLLAGAIMARGSIAVRLIALMRSVTDPIPGGLALATILSCAVFAAISGSSTVTLLAVGAIMYPALIQEGYSKSFALGALCAAGTLGIIIPPSIPLILYGVMTQTSIADLFIAGIGPALVLTGLMAAYSMAVNINRPRGSFDFRAIGKALRESVFALLTPVVILGGIYSGYFTPTESAAVAVFTALVVEMAIHRDMSVKDLYEVVGETAKLLGSLFPLLAFATALNSFLTFQELPGQLVEFMTGAVDSKLAFILSTNIILLLIGFVVDIGSAILILSPLLQPLATSANYGMDSVHFGIMMIVNLEIGYLTPPLGLNLIVAMGAFKEDFWTICKAVVPFIILMLIGLAIVIAIPQLSLFLL